MVSYPRAVLEQISLEVASGVVAEGEVLSLLQRAAVDLRGEDEEAREKAQWETIDEMTDRDEAVVAPPVAHVGAATGTRMARVAGGVDGMRMKKKTI